MPHDNSSGFIVVECQNPPNQNSKHVCIPKTWVQCEMGDNKVTIVYPSEDECRIATRLKNKEPADPGWQSYIGLIRYEADSYEDAIIGFVNRGKHSKQNEEQKIQKPQKKITRKVNSKSQPDAKAKGSLKVRIKFPKLDPMREKNKRSKIPMKKQLKAHTKGKINKAKHKNVKQETKESTSDFETQAIIKSPVQQSILNNSNSDVSNGTLSEHHAVGVQKEIDITHTNFSPADKQFLINLQIEQHETLEKIKGLTLYIKSLYLKVSKNKESLRQIFLKYQGQAPSVAVPLEKANDQNAHSMNEDNNVQDDESNEVNENASNEDKSMQNNEIDTDEENMTLIYEEDEIEEEERVKEDADDVEMENESEHYTSFSQTLTDTESAQNFSPFSPEVMKKYRKDDTRWTLKYPHSGKGLVQLGSSRIYLKAKGLEKCKKNSGDVRTFARQLYTEIFTQKALETCSMTGRKSFKGINKGVSSPPLHCHARAVIQTYAMNYGQAVGWKPITLRKLVMSLRCFLIRQRSKKARRLG